jgi:3-hydroxy-9,10-secoandrosta-1,3,5(10)-triene-9,17-dione monooxygenase
MIDDLLPGLRERAQETEDRRDVPPEHISALRKAGYFRLLQPSRYGGAEAHPVTYLTQAKRLSAACGSTGWVATLMGSYAWHLAQFPRRAQDDFWGDDPDALLSAGYAPIGKATTVPGGYRLSGRWSFISGASHADGMILGGRADGEHLAFLLPRSEVAVHDVWHSVGLAGTGSNDVEVDDAFVPGHRTLSFADTFRCVTPGQSVNTAALYRLPLFSLTCNTITTPIIGMAEGAYDAYVAHQKERVRVFAGTSAVEDPVTLARVAHAASDIDASWLQLTRNLERETDLAEAGREIPMALRAQVRRDQALGTARCIAALDRLFESSGVIALRRGTPLQRFWRDAHAARVHVANDLEAALKLSGEAAFGLPVQGTLL